MEKTVNGKNCKWKKLEDGKSWKMEKAGRWKKLEKKKVGEKEK